MNVFRGQLNRLKKAVASISVILGKILQEERNFISELNRRQLDQGEKASGASMPDYVTNSRSPSAPGKIKLFDTGEFHASIEPLFNGPQFELLSTDEKADILIGKYGEILGLNEESLILLRQRIKPKLIVRLRSML